MLTMHQNKLLSNEDKDRYNFCGYYRHSWTGEYHPPTIHNQQKQFPVLFSQRTPAFDIQQSKELPSIMM